MHIMHAPLLTGLLLFSSGAALAENRFGAIAYSLEPNVYGYAVDYDNRKDAEQVALAHCEAQLPAAHADDEPGDMPECVIELWFKNAYGALAVGSSGFGTGWGVYKQDAQLAALQKCGENTDDCDITLTVGTE